MIKISRRTLGVGYLCKDGKRCLMGEIFHHHGVPDHLMEGIDPSVFEIQKHINDDKVRQTFIRVTGAGNWTYSLAFSVVASENDKLHPHEAVAILKKYGIEVELVD